VPAGTTSAPTTPKSGQSGAASPPAGPPNPSSDVKPDVPTQAIIPIDQTGTRRGEAFAPKVNPKEGSYRGVTPKLRAEAQRVGEKYQGPGDYDVGHRVPLSQVPPGAKVRFRSEGANPNRADGDAIGESNVARKSAGLYTRY
jgi:hypothetical protein